MITPTPRAISPQDIVRIYVPPAPPDEQKTAQQISKLNKSPNTKDSKPNSISEANNIQQHPNNTNKISTSTNGSLNASPKKASPPQLHTPTASTVAATTIWSSKPLTGLENESNTNSIIYGSGDLTPVRGGFNQSDDDLTRSFIDASLSTNNSLGYIGIGGGGGGGGAASSSSRRGSLSRKSPLAMFESNMLMECSHMIKRRLSSQSNSSINFEVRDKLSNAASIENASNIANSNSNGSLSLQLNATSNGDGGVVGDTQKRMTSFEQLAATRYKRSDDKLNDEIDKYSPDDDESYSYSYYKSAESRQRSSPSTVECSKRFVSESNVQYESISMRRTSKEIEYQALDKRRPNSSGNETSLFQYGSFTVAPPHKSTSIKEYKRFYGTSNEDTCDDELKKSSDESSSSPNNKSVLNSPDTIPLLQSSSSPPSSHIPIAKIKSPTISTYPNIGLQLELPVKPSRIPVIYTNERKIATSTLYSPTAHISPNSSELNRVLPPIEVISSSSSSNNSISSRKLQKTPTSPNGKSIVYAPANRPKKLQSTNGTTIGDSNTIRIKVNQNDK